MLNRAVLTSVDGLAGVAGGFVVTGRVGNQLALFHYDFAARRCTGRALGDLSPSAPLFYLPECHAVVAALDSLEQGWALDLATGNCHKAQDTIDPSSRAARAWQHYRNRGLPYRPILLVAHRHGREGFASGFPFPAVCEVDTVESGQVSLHGLPPWGTFIPRADGQPALKGCLVHQVQCRGQTLALLCTQPGPQSSLILRLFRGPAGRALASYPLGKRDEDFTLSNDGEWVAFKVRRARLEIRRVLGDAPPVLTHTGGCSGELGLFLGRRSLLLLTGRQNTHLLRWDNIKLECRHSRDRAALLNGREIDMAVAVHERGSGHLPGCVRYDPERFVTGAKMRGLRAVCDRYGQVALFDSRDKLVCMFFAFREHLGGWMPDGTRLGPHWLTGGPPSPEAAEKFGRALRNACEGRSPS
jgi:hypothetical protein